jgi:hypothetical protein
MTHVVKFDCGVHQMDVKTTFVNGDMKKKYDIENNPRVSYK